MVGVAERGGERPTDEEFETYSGDEDDEEEEEADEKPVEGEPALKAGDDLVKTDLAKTPAADVLEGEGSAEDAEEEDEDEDEDYESDSDLAAQVKDLSVDPSAPNAEEESIRYAAESDKNKMRDMVAIQVSKSRAREKSKHHSRKTSGQAGKAKGSKAKADIRNRMETSGVWA